MRLAWLTDIHLNFVDLDGVEAFADSVAAQKPDAVLITGDIGEAFSVTFLLEALAGLIRRPIYFVLGNHDFYRGSIHEVRAAAAEAAAASPWLTWLPAAGVVPLTPDFALVGHDGWADGRCGDYDNSWVVLNDYMLIREFHGRNKQERLALMQSLGDQAAAYLRGVLPEALESHRRVLVAIHTPPFREACWHDGRISDDHYLPHFVCRSAGDALRDVADAYPASGLLVLCGHSHGAGRADVRPNLVVLTGGAEYGAPAVQRVFDLARWSE